MALENREWKLSSGDEARRQFGRKTGFDNGFLSGTDIVGYASQCHLIAIGVEDAIGSPRVAIARLTNAADVNEVFVFFKDRQDIEWFGANTFISHVGFRSVCVTNKAQGRVLVAEARRRIELRHDVSPVLGRVEGGVDDREISD